MAVTVHCSTIENYKSDKHGFDGMAALASLGHFFTVFFGAFALGCGMGCITALVLSSVLPLLSHHLRKHDLRHSSVQL